MHVASAYRHLFGVHIHQCHAPWVNILILLARYRGHIGKRGSLFLERKGRPKGRLSMPTARHWACTLREPRMAELLLLKDGADSASTFLMSTAEPYIPHV